MKQKNIMSRRDYTVYQFMVLIIVFIIVLFAFSNLHTSLHTSYDMQQQENRYNKDVLRKCYKLCDKNMCNEHNLINCIEECNDLTLPNYLKVKP